MAQRRRYFLISRNRDDHKVCRCTSGDQWSGACPNVGYRGQVSVTGPSTARLRSYRTQHVPSVSEARRLVTVARTS
ncbi:hypothetical protein CY34DRAFT_805788 [Suillus luteus UH-Slu-Lm8-n1]|uniref:Uncharacterized protein n=1 Tax=Suillus luteus UH-Slu-Lm8-n1 TaxID=930992 RepID=A0A0D0AII4_9AGAM|nr:hypothetical protein CY34DRAFT_805788 [Suillus luteus UH-Slu-Lm8-n1]